MTVALPSSALPPSHSFAPGNTSQPRGASREALALLDGRRVAIVHDWCPNFRGGERVLSELCRILGGPDVFTLYDFLSEEVKDKYFPGVRFITSPANRLPGIKHYYRSLFFAAPFLIEQFDVTGYDVVISQSQAFARGVLTRPDQPHLSYVNSPVRYAWDEQFSYLEQGRLGYGPKGLLFRYMLHKMRIWDVRTAAAPDVMLANSSFIRARIRRVYGRNSEVVFPPVHMDELVYSAEKDDYYVAASFLAPYKRTDLVIKAFSEMPDKRLVVVGEGQQSKSLRAIAGPNVTFTGFLPRQEYVKTVARAKALVFAGCEDFGIALAEAQACGTPLIAFGRGGAVDIVRPLGAAAAPTGVLFEKQTVTAVREAVARFEAEPRAISPAACRQNAMRFTVDAFERQVVAALARTLGKHAADWAPLAMPQAAE